MTNKNVLIISQSLTSGGAERVAANLASQLSESNNVWLLVLNGNVKTYSTSANLIDLKLDKTKGIVNKIFWYFKAIKKVKHYKKILKITHSVSFLSQPDLLNILTHKKEKTIVSVRNKRSSLNRGKLNKIKDKFIFKSADLIVSLSEGVKNDLINFYNIEADKIKTIYNSCDIDRIKEQISTKPKDEVQITYLKNRMVITAGRLNNQKGQWHLIRAFSRVVRDIKDAKLLILGQGEEEEYLKDLIDKLNLQNNVMLIGYHNNPYYYLSKCDLFVFSSIYEGFGNILLEAMACELPIISSDCMVGPRELLAPGTSYSERVKDAFLECDSGILIPTCDGKHYDAEEELTKEEMIMADVIKKVLNNIEILEKYKEKSKKRIKDFEPHLIKEEWEKVINEL